MNAKQSRKEFAKGRPLPPFGRVVNWFVEMAQLKNPDSYDRVSDDLLSALTELDKRTADTVFAGDMVSESSKEQICEAVARCMCIHPSLPFRAFSKNALAKACRALWAAYESLSCRLTSHPADSAVLLRVLARHAAVTFAVRAGAMAWLYGDYCADDEIPVWSDDESLSRCVQDALQMCFNTRDEAVTELQERAGTNSPGASEFDRWLDGLDVPAPNHIRHWDMVLASAVQGKAVSVRSNHLWRLYAGRRLHNFLRDFVPADFRVELLRAYSKIKRSVFAYLCLERRFSDEERHQRALLLAIIGHVVDPLMAHQVLQGQSDALWRSHVEAAICVNDAPTRSFAELCQRWVAFSGIYAEIPADHRPPSLDELARIYLSKSERGGDPSAEYAKLAETASRYLNKGQYENADEFAQRLVKLAPLEPGPWELVATIRMFQKRKREAELFYRTALQLEPRYVEVRSKLVSLLDSSGRLDEAQKILFECPPEQRDSADWIFAHGKLLLKQGRHLEAKQELLKCVKRGFLLGICYQLLSVAAAWLGERDEQREYEKRAKELGAVLS